MKLNLRGYLFVPVSTLYTGKFPVEFLMKNFYPLKKVTGTCLSMFPIKFTKCETFDLNKLSRADKTVKLFFDKYFVLVLLFETSDLVGI